MANNMFWLKISPNLVMFDFFMQVSILNGGAMVVIFDIFVTAAIQNGPTTWQLTKDTTKGHFTQIKNF